MASINIAANHKFKQLGQKQICNEKTIYAENYGCAANVFDFEILIKQLSDAGYHLTNSVDLASIILINTCGVKKPTEDRIIGRLQKLSETKKPLIITGCLPSINPKAISKAAPDFSVSLDPHNIDKILEAVKLAEKGEKRRIFISKKPILKLTFERVILKPPIEIILISEGCAGSCSYCCVRFARGALFSYPKEAVVQSLRQAVRNGIKEIWLTSQDTGAYGLDIHANLAELLRECCNVEGKFFIRVGMMNPNYILSILDELINAYRGEKIFKFIHLPVQSGDNLILKKMNRKYSVEDYLTIVHRFREKIPEITLSTDIICGFPGEKEDNFKKTLDLIRQVKPDIVNVSKFFPRPHTSAEKMKRIDVSIIKQRSTLLSYLVKKITYERNQKWVGWEGEILIDEQGKGKSWIGRNFSYKPIVVKDNRNLLGKFVNVKVTKSFSTYLEAELVNI